MLAFRLLQRGLLAEEYIGNQFQYLLRGPVRTDVENPLPEWLPNTAWFCVQKLIEIDFFSTFAGNLEKDAPNRFKEWFNEINPEAVSSSRPSPKSACSACVASMMASS